MKILALVISSAFAVVMTGCVTVADMSREIKNGNAKLLPATIDVTAYGVNYRIGGLVEAGQQRETVFVYATDCQKGYGSLGTDVVHPVYIENVLAAGAKPVDKLFAQMCRLGLATAEHMESQLTDQQKADRLRARQQTH